MEQPPPAPGTLPPLPPIFSHEAGSPQPPTPGVVVWFIVYCVLMALMCMGGCAVGSIFFVIDPADLEMEPAEAKIVGAVYILFSTIFFVPFAAAPFLPRRKWVWVYDLVMICLGFTSCCTLPACIALLIFWIKPETRLHFGWT